MAFKAIPLLDDYLNLHLTWHFTLPRTSEKLDTLLYDNLSTAEPKNH
jgi:hypothetical protein